MVRLPVRAEAEEVREVECLVRQRNEAPEAAEELAERAGRAERAQRAQQIQGKFPGGRVVAAPAPPEGMRAKELLQYSAARRLAGLGVAMHPKPPLVLESVVPHSVAPRSASSVPMLLPGWLLRRLPPRTLPLPWVLL